jgi:response regulator NasT
MAEARILIAEGNDLVAQSLGDQLNALGYQVVATARNGRDAVRLANEMRPDLVILDMQIPGSPADAVAKQISERAPVPIIMISAASDPDTILRAGQAGALSYLVKPIKPEELPPAIDIALARFREVRKLRAHVDELQETLDASKLIERAKGILMRRLRISDADAEGRIRQRAQEKSVPVKEIAQAIVDSDALLS